MVKQLREGQKSSRMIRVRERTFDRLKAYGELGEPVDVAVSRCLDYAEKGRQVLAQKVTA